MFRSSFKRLHVLVGSYMLLLLLLVPLSACAQSAFVQSASVQTKMAKADSDHYLVEFKAWIPQASVPDPTLFTPFQFPNSSIPALGEPLRSCFSQAADNDMEGSTDVLSSSFHGDDHSNYGASPPAVGLDYRVLERIQFDFDGTQIRNFSTLSGPAIPNGATTRDIVIRNSRGDEVTCSQEGETTPESTEKQINSTSFTMSVSGIDPLSYPPNVNAEIKELPGFKNLVNAGIKELTPKVSGEITGHITSSGDITFDYQTNLFPSYGITVLRNSHIVMQNIINDASCAPTQGYSGAAEMLLRLISFGGHTGTATRASGNVGCVKNYLPPIVQFVVTHDIEILLIGINTAGVKRISLIYTSHLGTGESF